VSVECWNRKEITHMKSSFTFLCGVGLLALASLPGRAPTAAAGPADEAGLAALIRDLRSSDEGVRFKAAKALGKLGPEARAAIPTLTRLASDDPDDDVRRVARTAVAGIIGIDAAGGGVPRAAGIARGGRARPAGKPVTREELLSGKWGETNQVDLFQLRFDNDGTVSGVVPELGQEIVIGTYTYEGNVLTITYCCPGSPGDTYHLTWQSKPNLIVAEQKGVLGGREIWKRVP
jgi:hypothetical protein